LPFQTTIHIGHLSFELNVTAIVDSSGNYLGNALEWSDVTAAKASELEVSRLMSAVQGITTAIMMVDRDFNVTYANPASVELLNSNLGELRQVYPGLNPNELVGSNIDMFHKNPHHQRQLLSDSTNLPHKANIKVGPLEFSLVVSAITDAHGEYIGATLEWSDITQQKDGERQIEGLIAAASKGDLSQRVDHAAYSGFMKNLGEGINHLLDAVVQPVRGAKQVIAALAEGDLCEQMDGEYDGEFAELRDSLNGSIANLTDMVGRINESAASINTAASEIAQGNSDLSKRTEDQASSLEETAASLEEITSTVKQNAENARQANQAAIGAREQAEKGGDVVSTAIIAMQEVSSSSKKVADIIGVIDEIAFQTNLLALNAAVEAARAGEQGRGFAVVATEVRNLAQRSATAAKEIKSLIQESGEKVQEGSELVNESGKTLEEIVGSVKEVVDIIAEIAAASNEQALGIEQINQAVGQMDQMTQQNAALVEESAAASESMEQQAAEMSSMMEYFTLPGAAAPSVVSAPTHARAPQAAKRVARSTVSASPRSPSPAPQVDYADDDEWSEF
ncbi:MAG TPA: methyl-accepting chemotaxis protein, partial [Gammaproteobacteria bacterium]|nr:methyl-accepting chemotaxis protein [Gammaproteobacteria bacterium]